MSLGPADPGQVRMAEHERTRGQVSTSLPTRSPVWSIPSCSDGYSMAGVQKKVVVKPLPLATTPAAQGRVLVAAMGGAGRGIPLTSPSIGASRLAELTSQLTPAQAQTIDNLLYSVKQLSASASAPRGAAMATPPPPPLQVYTAGKNKPLMPKHPLTMVPPATPSLTTLPQSVHIATHKVVAPVAIPPGPHLPPSPASLLPQLSSLLPSLPHAPAPPQECASRPSIRTNKPRKPCHCKNSQCLKLYCDCFANGEFCREGCQCHSCKNNVDHSEERARAVKICLDRNPHAFKPKVGPNKSGDVRRHVKGCNCKRSGCLKNYCECYEAKIPCSALCRCIGCRNLPEKPENKSLMQLADAADIRTQQQQAATTHLMDQLDLTSSKPEPHNSGGQRLPFSFINKEVAKATCLCLLEEASHMLMSGKSVEEVERAVLEEFGHCLNQIITSAQSAGETDCPITATAVE